ncbi:hypothetical protein GS474_23790 [Rhodococcus hoagii]|nr:hypothetical protein [Prescottella equi]
MSTAEQIIAEHRWSALTDACKCGDPTISWGAHPAHVVAALTNAGKTIVERGLLNQATISLDAAAQIVDNHASMLAQLVMDTPKDQELTDRLVELARNSAQNIRSAAARVAEGGDQP